MIPGLQPMIPGLQPIMPGLQPLLPVLLLSAILAPCQSWVSETVIDQFYFVPDWDRKPEEQTIIEEIPPEADDMTLIWDVELATDFDNAADEDDEGDGHDVRAGQLKTKFYRIQPSRTFAPVERTVPSYDSEEPNMVGLGMEEMWSPEVGKGRGRGGGCGANYKYW